jgi:hypothetical protein
VPVLNETRQKYQTLYLKTYLHVCMRLEHNSLNIYPERKMFGTKFVEQNAQSTFPQWLPTEKIKQEQMSTAEPLRYADISHLVFLIVGLDTCQLTMSFCVWLRPSLST